MKIGLLDRDEIYRAGLRTHLEADPEVEGIAEAASFEEAIILPDFRKVDVIVLDIESLGKQKEILLPLLVNSFHRPVLALVGENAGGLALQAFRAGVKGYVFKGSGSQSIRAGIKAIHCGLRCLTASCWEQIEKEVVPINYNLLPASTGTEGPTPRGLEILKLVSAGLSNEEIAARLGIKVRTVKSHLAELYSRLGVHSRTQAVRLGLERGWLSAQ